MAIFGALREWALSCSRRISPYRGLGETEVGVTFSFCGESNLSGGELFCWGEHEGGLVEGAIIGVLRERALSHLSICSSRISPHGVLEEALGGERRAYR